jgi:tetratricopeptide (TPR) repeat protein
MERSRQSGVTLTEQRRVYEHVQPHRPLGAGAGAVVQKPDRRTYRLARVVGTLGLCLLAILLLRPAWPRFRSSPPRSGPPVPLPRTPAAAARRAALRYWARAQQDVNRQRYALEAWDPAADGDLDPETLRLQLLAVDRTGDLRRALKAGEQAAVLARTPEDKYASALLLAGLESAAGHPAAALAQARKVTALRPHDSLSLLLLWQAERCDWRGPFARSPVSWRRRHLRLEQAKNRALVNRD